MENNFKFKKSIKKNLTIFYFLFSVFSVSSQLKFTNIQLKDAPGGMLYHSVCEPAIAIDPNNPDIMAAGSIIDDYYYSTDGGKTWKSSNLKSEFGVWGDPVITFDYSGRVYYFHLADYKKTSWIDRIVCQSADQVSGKFDNGTFPKPNGTKAQDKHWVVVNPNSNEIYLTWTQFDKYDSKSSNDSSVILFSKSSDQGKSWADPIRISYYAGDCLDGDNTVEGAVPALGPNGEIYVTWSGPKGLVMQKSLDGGLTWLEKEKEILLHEGGWDFFVPGLQRANGLPVLVSDMSDGPNKGTLYLNWCDQKNGKTDTDVWLSKSTDDGNTWTEPIRVNQDKTKSHQFLTWMTIDQSDGALYFVYYDRRNHKSLQTDVYLSASFDGGVSFHDFKLNNKSFTPSDAEFLGDYLNIAAVDGVIRPIYPRMDDLKMTLWVTLVSKDELIKSIGQ
jgi:hypothetical protein